MNYNSNDINESYYLHHNQQQYPRKVENKKEKTKKISNNNVVSKSKTNLIQSSSSGSNGFAPSTTSSDRLLVVVEEKKVNLTYCFLVLAIIGLVFSLITIAITFIFPFWIRLSFGPYNSTSQTQSSSSSSYLNLTNNQISLIVRELNNLSFVNFDLGIWEVKMYQDLELVDLESKSSSKNAYPRSMLWLNSDINNEAYSFLNKFLKFIDLKSASLFTVQILEILHLIFTFFSFAFTSFTLCLCTSHKQSISWYLVSFFMSVISFLAGIAVIILIYIWIRNSGSIFSDNSIEFKMTYNWCFWSAVGINGMICLAAFLILMFVLVASIIYYKNVKKLRANGNLKVKRGNEKKKDGKQGRNKTGHSFYNNNFDNVITLENDLHENSTSRLPRFIDPSHSTPSLAEANNISRHMKYPNEQLMSRSYVFYTGHGNYHMQPIENNFDRVDYEIENDFNANNTNYPNYQNLMKLTNHNQHLAHYQPQRTNLHHNHHPYSNDNNQHDFKYLNGPR
jgi:hypothetical protein